MLAFGLIKSLPFNQIISRQVTQSKNRISQTPPVTINSSLETVQCIFTLLVELQPTTVHFIVFFGLLTKDVFFVSSDHSSSHTMQRACIRTLTERRKLMQNNG